MVRTQGGRTVDEHHVVVRRDLRSASRRTYCDRCGSPTASPHLTVRWRPAADRPLRGGDDRHPRPEPAQQHVVDCELHLDPDRCPSRRSEQACGSRSIKHLAPGLSPKAAPVEATVVVLATPPFWLATATIRESTPYPEPQRLRVIYCALVSTPRSTTLPGCGMLTIPAPGLATLRSQGTGLGTLLLAPASPAAKRISSESSRTHGDGMVGRRPRPPGPVPVAGRARVQHRRVGWDLCTMAGGLEGRSTWWGTHWAV